MTWLAVIGALNMAMALYYYVAIIAAIYLQSPSETPPVIASGVGAWLAVRLSVAGTLTLGILPGPGLALMQLIASLV